jgi:hypothetical protein
MRTLVYLNVICLILVACDFSKNDITTNQEAIESTKHYTIKEREKYILEIETKKDNTKTQITVLKKKLTGIKEAQKKKLESKINTLEKKLNHLETKTDELKNSPETAYHRISLSVDSAIVDLNKAIEATNKEFE